jgi:hypothetical protein
MDLDQGQGWGPVIRSNTVSPVGQCTRHLHLRLWQHPPTDQHSNKHNHPRITIPQQPQCQMQ